MATPAIRRTNRTEAATVRCADDTEATCNITALNDVRALYERAVAVAAAADAAARPTATKLLFHLNLAVMLLSLTYAVSASVMISEGGNGTAVEVSARGRA